MSYGIMEPNMNNAVELSFFHILSKFYIKSQYHTNYTKIR